MKDVISGTGVARLAGCLPLLLTLSAGAVNVTFDGKLLDRPCQIDPGSLNQTVQFLERPVKDFQYAPGGVAENFSIRLVQCNTNTIWKTVKLKFSGDKESAMKERADYFLKVTGKYTGKLAIGLLDTDGTTLV
ncbi:fimbrial protein [Escherichia coli]